ncbi:glycosyltransferase [Cyanobium sp. ATX 6E8]|uniref:glycosyltransferase n=1 Tax=Cyanobium sp. ATX 6E8 TaxID=2823701 RepID=UPI0020CEC494|nr:glycosyltransferase [Cyanobium sp. ATX 6E8]
MVAPLPRYWLALHPDLERPIGGVKQMHRFAEALTACGRQATVIQEQAGFHPGWFRSAVATIGLKQWRQQAWRSAVELSPERDVVVLPETFLNVFERYAPGLPKLIFNQNGAYSFGTGKPKDAPDPAEVLRLYRHPELLHVLCVSEHDERLLAQGFGLGRERVSRLVNAIEPELFRPGGGPKRRQIAYMPRKNGRDAAVVAALLQAQPWWPGWQLVPIHKQPQAEVARILQESLVFLAFGHPEGFGLPLAEALACGCALVGYSGLGGRELLALGAEHGVALEVAYGDWFGFVEAVAAFNRSLQNHQPEVLAALLSSSKAVRSRYSPYALQASVAAALPQWEARLRDRLPADLMGGVAFAG